MKHWRARAWVFGVLGLASSAVECTERDTSTITVPAPFDEEEVVGAVSPLGCVPGQTAPCTGACGDVLSGYQVCAPDGRSYGACICPSARALAPLASSSGRGEVIRRRPSLPESVLPGRLSPPGANPPPTGSGLAAAVVGAACRTRSDCAGGLDCLPSASNSLGNAGGPAGGYCTLPCSGAADCTSLDPASTCASLRGQNLCTRTCGSKEPAPNELKCLGRPELTCVSVAALGEEEPSAERQLGICVPQCQSDEECEGRRCDLGTGLCADAPSPGSPIGAACDAPEDCAAGICLAVSDQAQRFCSAFCTLGVPGCGFDGSESSIGAGCLLSQVPGEGAGDRGLCVELCDVPEDCREPGAICVPEPTDGRAGVCLVPLEPEPGGSLGEPGSADIGQTCAADMDCASGTCLTSDSDPFLVGGGPAQGYCSAPCAGDADCLEEGAICAITPGGSYCLLGCDVGAAGQCLGRDTLGCALLGGGTRGFCAPQCSSDADCDGRFCGLTSGLCVDVPECESDADCAVGTCDIALGVCSAEASCDDDADCESGSCDVQIGSCAPGPECESDTDCESGSCDGVAGLCREAALSCTTDADCEGGSCDVLSGTCSAAPGCTRDADCGEQVCDPSTGLCIEEPAIPAGGACTEDAECAAAVCFPIEDAAFCSGFCLLGTSTGCEPYGSDVFCLVPFQDPVGLCIELCDVASDCAQAGFDCVPIGGTVNGRSGGCLPPLP